MSWKLDKKDDRLEDFLDGMAPHLKRFKRSWRKLFKEPAEISHAFTNIFVEASRLSPYHAGHFWMFQTLFAFCIIIMLISITAF